MSEWLKLPSGAYIQPSSLIYVTHLGDNGYVYAYNIGEHEDPSVALKDDDAKVLIAWLDAHCNKEVR